MIAAGAAGLTWWYFNTKKDGKPSLGDDEDLEIAELLKLARKLKKGKKKKTLKKSTASETEEYDQETSAKTSPRAEQKSSPQNDMASKKKKVVVPTLNLSQSHQHQ